MRETILSLLLAAMTAAQAAQAAQAAPIAVTIGLGLSVMSLSARRHRDPPDS